MEYEMRSVESLSPQDVRFLIHSEAQDIYEGRTQRDDWYKAIAAFYRINYGESVGKFDEKKVRVLAEEQCQIRRTAEWQKCRRIAARELRCKGDETPSEQTILETAQSIEEKRRKGWQDYDWLTAERKVHERIEHHKKNRTLMLVPVGPN